MNREKFFDIVMNLCDWAQLGDDDRVLAPLIAYLSRQPDEEIFSFDEIMTELLFALDTRKHFRRARRYYPHSDDTFLYARCCALTNGEAYYEKVRAGKINRLWRMEFEAILYVPMEAWGKKHGKDCCDYPYLTEKSYETGSNEALWQR